jgi:hypothetical protein
LSVRLDLPHRLGGHCGSSAYRDLAEFYGCSWTDEPLSEGVAFGIGGALGFLYHETPELPQPVYLVGRTARLERFFCRHMGIDLDRRETDDPDEGWAWLKAELDAGRPTMIWADIGHLEYLRVRMHNTRHDIVVCGYDTDRGVAFIADNDREEIEPCSLESLARARSSTEFPGPVHHRIWAMRWPERPPDARQVVATALESSIAGMTTGGHSLLKDDDAAGLVQVRQFAERYPLWPDMLGDDLAAALQALWVFIVKAGTGGAMFRSLHAQFLRDMGELLDDPGLRAAGDVYDELAATWVELASGTAGLRDGADPLAVHADGVELVERIDRLEHEGVEAMRAVG